MAQQLVTVSVIGYIGDSIKLNLDPEKSARLSFGVATNHNPDRNDKAKSVALWWNFNEYGKRAQSLHEHGIVSKGAYVCVTGELTAYESRNQETGEVTIAQSYNLLTITPLDKKDKAAGDHKAASHSPSNAT